MPRRTSSKKKAAAPHIEDDHEQQPPIIPLGDRFERDPDAGDDIARAMGDGADDPEDTAPPAPPAPLQTREEKLAGMEFFDMLAALDEREWEDRVVYLYRLEPRVKNAGKQAYIDKFAQPIDEEVVKETHGGGTYQAILKNTADREGPARKYNFSIAGCAPKLIAGQTFVDPAAAAAAEAAAAAAPVPAGALPATDVARLCATLDRMVEKLSDKGQGQDGAVGVAIEGVKQVQKLMVDSMVPKDAKSAITDTLALVRELNAINGGGAAKPDAIGELEKIVKIAEMLGLKKADDPIDLLSKMRGVLGEDAAVGAAAGKGGLASLLAVVAPQIPELAKTVREGFQVFKETKMRELEVAGVHANARLIEAQRGLPPGAVSAAPAPAAAVPRPATVGAAAAPGTVPHIEIQPFSPGAAPANGSAAPGVTAAPGIPLIDVSIDDVLAYARRLFDSGTPGGGAVDLLEERFPGVISQLVTMIGTDVTTIRANLGSTPQFADVAADKEASRDFTTFVAEFVAEITAPGVAQQMPAASSVGTA